MWNPVEPNKELVAHYEQLRNDALSLAAGRTPAPGLALFLGKGMIAWMRAWSPYVQNAAAESPSPVSAPYCSVDIRAQIATILAGVILSREPEVAACK